MAPFVLVAHQVLGLGHGDRGVLQLLVGAVQLATEDGVGLVALGLGLMSRGADGLDPVGEDERQVGALGDHVDEQHLLLAQRRHQVPLLGVDHAGGAGAAGC